MDLYDEFGNYIGGAEDDEEDEEEEEQQREEHDQAAAGEREEGPQAGDMRMRDSDSEDEAAEQPEEDDYVSTSSRAVILHEDKKYYAAASEVYPDAEVLVEEEDAQPLTQPIIAPLTEKKFSYGESQIPMTTFEPDFMVELMKTPELCRNVAVAGHLHHGKTSFVDMFVQQSHEKNWESPKNIRYTDTRKDEQELGCSIKATPISLVLPGGSGTVSSKHYLVSFMDAPGHVNFSDEATAAIRLADGILVVVDAVEGVMCQTERVVRQACQDGLPIILVISKIDRLILELKLPPTDAYHKLRHIVDSVNSLMLPFTASKQIKKLTPELGNVVFASGMHGWCFTLESFSQMYADRAQVKYKPGLPTTPAEVQAQAIAEAFGPKQLAARLWGDVYFHPESRTFRRSPPPQGGPRSFVEFVLDPLYKVYASVIGEESELCAALADLNVHLRRAERREDVQPMLRMVLARWLGRSGAGGVVDAICKHVPSPLAAARTKVESCYTGPLDGAYGKALLACDASGPLVVHVCKLYTRADTRGFDAFGRIMSGTLRVGERVKVLGEAYSEYDEEDMAEAKVAGLSVMQARYTVPLVSATAGNWVLIEGVDETIVKTATIVNSKTVEQPYIFMPLQFNTTSTVKLAVEPLNPSELPKMLEALRKINKSYPLAITKKEESGEHTIIGTGELYLDCIMRDLRDLYGDIEVKVADPVVCFCETVVETSSVKCFAHTPNKKNKLTMICEPLDKGLAEEIERRDLKAEILNEPKSAEAHFTKKYKWDLLAARSVWAFGPESQGPNLLLDDTLPTEVNKTLLGGIKRFIVQGFQWGTREGPLCEEPIRGTKFKLLGATIANEELARSGVQIIPTARRVCYSAFLMATPRLMEPIYYAEIQTPQDCIATIHSIISRRRGQVFYEGYCPGTPLHILKAYVPVIDSFGFETDLRTQTQGQAFCLQVFDHWAVVPGDPTDSSIVLRPLEPAPTPHLAREFMIKTRRRKGLSEDVSPAKFFDEELVSFMAGSGSSL